MNASIRRFEMNHLLLAVLAGLMLSLISCKERANNLRIAVAANAQFAVEELALEFEAETGIHAEIIIGASGQLSTQIMQGAPYDVFLSANMKYPQELFDQGKTTGAPVVYGTGRLVFWSLNDSIPPNAGTHLSLCNIRKLAIANPEHAPYGIAAMQFLERSGQLDQTEELLVYGESISQVNQFLLSGAASHALTAEAVVKSPELEAQGTWIPLPIEFYDPILQGAVVIRSERFNQSQAESFLIFLQDEKAKLILKKFGL